MEHSYLRNGSVLAISHLLYQNNPWAGKRIVWAGDYGTGKFENEFPESLRLRRNDDGDEYEYPLYAIASQWFEELGVQYESGMMDYDQRLDHELDQAVNNGALDIRYFVNEDRNEYIDLIQAGQGYREDIYIHPLPILCSYGCGEGGGDYLPSEDHPSVPFIGLWVGQRIRAYKEGEEDALTGYKLITPGFTEAD